MEGNSGTATPAWDLGMMHWAPAGSGYPDPFVLRAGGGEPSRDGPRQQKEHQTWLNLGKQPCCWTTGGCPVPPQPSWGQVRGSNDGGSGGTTAAAESKKKEKAASAAAAAVPRCQVDGCHVALAGSKEYHRRHKVCEVHSKAPRVVVLGAEQRFCQQCSRFHAISEFDDAKRSCRRRLAGHNERRRKNNASEAMARSAGHPHGLVAFGHGGFPSSPAGALSLLSSARGGGAPWPIPAAADISARSSAALDDLIAENRLLAWQFFSDRSPGRLALFPGEVPGWHTAPLPGGGAAGRYSFVEASGTGHTTLDLMQTPVASSAGAPPFRPVPERAARTANKDGESGCVSDGWASVEGPPGRVVV